jgi:cob(I)alamin adenosyltransferase
MKLYTRTGDAGNTAVIGARVAKDDPRIEAIGTIDELNAFVGQAAAMIGGEDEMFADLQRDLTVIQHELFDCGSDLAMVRLDAGKLRMSADIVARLESWIDRYHEAAPPLSRFILPGGSPLAAALHVCRTVCRRAERRIVTLAGQQEIHREVQRYVNRLSDFFFAAARAVNARLGLDDVEYERSAEVFRFKS